MSDTNIFADDENPSPLEQKPISLHQQAQANLGFEIKPLYREIKAAYISSLQNPDQEGSVDQLDLEKNGVFIMSSIAKGAQVTPADIAEMRRAVYYNSYTPRGPVFTVRRMISNFIGLSVCNVIVLLLSIILMILIFLNNNGVCPAFAKANLFYAILSGVWVFLTLTGMYGAHKRSLRHLKFFMAGILVILGFCVIVTAYGMLTKDDDPQCNDDSSQSIILISTAVFTLLDVAFFMVLSRRLRNLLIWAASRRNRNANNSSPDRNRRENGNSNSRNNSPNRGNRSQQAHRNDPTLMV